jgi:RimJ/RimL family protein N-acetyltransferase
MITKPLLDLPVDQVQFYFQSLYKDDTLKYRLADLKDPAWDDVVRMITRHGRNMFCVVDNDKIVAEFMLENFKGRAAQIHFSMHPENKTGYSLQVARKTMAEVMSWPMIDALYGLTPTENRRACWFVLKVGFRKLGILPSGLNYLGGVSDAMISLMTGEAHG